MTFDERFRQRAAAHPDAVALETAEGAVSYGQLDARVSALAHALVERGVVPGTLVTLSLPRGIEAVAGLLAVFRAGAVAVPLDPAAPPERRALILEDAQPLLTLTPRSRVGDFEKALAVEDIPAPGHPFPPRGGPEDLAYVIYTSGSTGRPKGVMVDRASLEARIGAGVERFGVRAGDRLLQFASPAFDASLLEMGLALAAGATLCVADPRGPPTGAALVRFLADRVITVVILPPSVLGALPDAELPALRTVIVGGEVCRPQVVARWAPGRRFFNCYGPTEATIWASDDECAAGAEPTLGFPLPATFLRVLHPDRLDPVEAGEVGEIAVGGTGVARGYLNRPDLTAERFVPDPATGGRLYRSGDLGRFRSDGKLEFLGRLDRQVKIRGHRIELGEVEAALARFPDAVDAAVVADQDSHGETRLVGYLVTRAPAPGPLPRLAAEALRASLRAFLSPRLPEPFIPSAFIEMAALPLGANGGKVDRALLPALETLQTVSVPILVPATTPLERAVAAIWMEVLMIPRVGIHQPFFDIGGNSLRAADVQARLSGALGREIPLVTLYEHPTIAALAAYLARDREEPLPAPSTRGAARRTAASVPRSGGRRATPSLDGEEDFK